MLIVIKVFVIRLCVACVGIHIVNNEVLMLIAIKASMMRLNFAYVIVH